MASAAYLALLERANAAWIMLALITAREGLKGWASAGSGAYSIAWDPYTHPTTIRADRGLYRQLLAVYENGTALTVRANLATVQANPGSYFYDEAAETLYVETSGSVSPDTLSLLQVVFAVRVATSAVAFDGIPPFDAQIDGQTAPSIRMDRPELLRGIIAFPSGDLSLQNADGFWDYPAAKWLWPNGTIEFKLGGDGLAYSDYETVAVMQIAREPSAGDEVATFQLRSRGNATDRAFPQSLLATLYGQSAGQGRYMPMLWGRVVDVPCQKSHQTSGSRNFWAINDGVNFSSDVLTIESAEKVERGTGLRTALVESTDYWYPGGALRHGIEVHTSIDAETYDVVVTVDRAAGQRTCGAVALSILRLCGIPDALIDTASFDQADLDNPAVLGLYVPGGATVDVFTTGTELLNRLERSCLLSVYIAPTGLWTAQVWDPSFDWAALTRRTDADLFECRHQPDVTKTATANISVRYGQAHYANTWQVETTSRDDARYRLDADSTEPVETCLANAADASVLANRLQLVGSNLPIEIEIEDGPHLLTYSPGDKIRIQRDRGPSLTGTFDQPMEIERISKSISTVAVQATVSNMRGLGAKVKRPAPDGVLDWATATDDEKMQYIFICDDSGFIVAGDPTTYQHSIFW